MIEQTAQEAKARAVGPLEGGAAFSVVLEVADQHKSAYKIVQLVFRREDAQRLLELLKASLESTSAQSGAAPTTKA
jgi:hypothetical protein